VTDPVSGVVVLHRDAHLLVLCKPSGLPTTSPNDEDTLVRAAEALDPDAERLHPSSRLDAEVTGVVIFARTKQATEHLIEARARSRYRRGYLALTGAAPTPPNGQWSAAIAFDARDRRKRAAVPQGRAGGKQASTLYTTLARAGERAALWLEPRTGRTHQLRVHAADAGVPLLGDRHYGGATRVVLADGRVVAFRRTMLHCASVCVPDLSGAGSSCFQAPLPADLREAWRALGGAELRLPALEPPS
jgi:23S rRNA-/tRNA-specific pseudouridylate synthase